MLGFKKKKIAILCIHGFAGGIHDIEDVANYLELNKNFDVFAFTLPGHDEGLFIKTKKEDWIKACEDKINWLIDNDYDSIYLVGHSMGCILSCIMATKYKQIKKLVLLSPAFKYMENTDDKFDLFKSITNSKKILGDYKTSEVIARFSQVPVSTLKSFMELTKENQAVVKNICVPILIVHGKEDYIAPLSSGEYVHNSVSSKVNILVKVAGANHEILKCKSKKEILKLVSSFLKLDFIISRKDVINI